MRKNKSTTTHIVITMILWLGAFLLGYGVADYNKVEDSAAMKVCYAAHGTIEFKHTSNGGLLCQSKVDENVWYHIQ